MIPTDDGVLYEAILSSGDTDVVIKLGCHDGAVVVMVDKGGDLAAIKLTPDVARDLAHELHDVADHADDC